MAVKEITEKTGAAESAASADEFDAEFARLMAEDTAPKKTPEKPIEAAPPKAEEKPSDKAAEKPSEQAPPKAEEKPSDRAAEKPSEQAPPKAEEKPVEKEPEEPSVDELLASAGILVPKRPDGLDEKLKELAERDPELVAALRAHVDHGLAELSFSSAKALVEIDRRHRKEVEPVRDAVEKTARRSAIADEGLTSDMPAVAAWIKEQPGLVRGVYQNVYDKGTVAEVKELHRIYKQSQAPSQPEQRPAAGPDGGKAPVMPEPKKPNGAEHLTAVPSKRASPDVGAAGSVDKDDFAGGWIEAARLEAEGRAQ